MQNELTQRQTFAWAMGALCVPIMLTCAQKPWPSVLAAGMIASAIYIIMYKSAKMPLGACYVRVFGKAAKPILALGALWTVLAAADTARHSAAIYGDAVESHYCVFAILALAAWTVWHKNAAKRCAAVLAPVLTVGFGVFILSALPQIEWEWLRTAPSVRDGADVLSVLLLPTTLFFFPQERKRPPIVPFVCFALVPAVVSAATVGCLSGAVAGEEPFAFYTLSQSLSLFSVVERFEPIVSALSFGAFYVLTALLLESAAKQLGYILPNAQEERIAPLCGAAAFCILPVTALLPQSVFSVTAAILWGALPLGTLLVVGGKNI